MSCRTMHLPWIAPRAGSEYGLAIACGPRVRRPRRRCVVCNVPDTMASIRLCDAPIGKGKTCDSVVCVEHVVHIEPNTDFCPLHAGQASDG